MNLGGDRVSRGLLMQNETGSGKKRARLLAYRNGSKGPVRQYLRNPHRTTYSAQQTKDSGQHTLKLMKIIEVVGKGPVTRYRVN